MVTVTSLESVNKLIDELRSVLLAAGIHIKFKSKNPTIPTLNRAFDWLHDLKLSEEYKYMKYVYSLRPPDTWRRYELFEIEGLAEQELLKKAIKNLLKRWRIKRPTTLGTKKSKKP